MAPNGLWPLPLRGCCALVQFLCGMARYGGLQRSGAAQRLRRPKVKGSARLCRLGLEAARGGCLWAGSQGRSGCRASTLLGDWEGKPSDDPNGLNLCSEQVHPGTPQP